MSKELKNGWEAQAAVVQAVRDGGKVEDMDHGAVNFAVAYGLIESLEQKKACPSCGTPKFDFRYWKVTPAGHLLADAFSDARKAQGAQQ